MAAKTWNLISTDAGDQLHPPRVEQIVAGEYSADAYYFEARARRFPGERADGFGPLLEGLAGKASLLHSLLR